MKTMAATLAMTAMMMTATSGAAAGGSSFVTDEAAPNAMRNPTPQAEEAFRLRDFVLFGRRPAWRPELVAPDRDDGRGDQPPRRRRTRQEKDGPTCEGGSCELSSGIERATDPAVEDRWSSSDEARPARQALPSTAESPWEHWENRDDVYDGWDYRDDSR